MSDQTPESGRFGPKPVRAGDKVGNLVIKSMEDYKPELDVLKDGLREMVDDPKLDAQTKAKLKALLEKK